jgi:hypothetical protein
VVIRPDTPFCVHPAAKLCATLERFRLTCQPTIFAGRHLALDAALVRRPGRE